MSKKYLLPNNYDIPYSHFLDKELRKSLQFQKKHEKELNQLITQQELMKIEKEKNLNKLQMMFHKERLIDENKKFKDRKLKEQKLTKDQQMLYKQKESNYLDSLDASWCFYQEFSPKSDFKPFKVRAERDSVITYLTQQLQLSNDPNEKALLKKKIQKFKDSETQNQKNNYIDNKLKFAHQLRNDNLDKSIEKIKLHELHIMDVQDKNNQLNFERFQYYSEKNKQIDNKIKQISHQQELIKLDKQQLEQMKDYHRKVVKSNSVSLLHEKQLINQNHINEKLSKLNQLKEQKKQIEKLRQNQIDREHIEKGIVRGSLEHIKYPMLNSINYKEQFI